MEQATRSEAGPTAAEAHGESLVELVLAIQQEQLQALQRLRSSRQRLRACNESLDGVLASLRSAGRAAGADVRGMRQDLDGAYQALGALERRVLG